MKERQLRIYCETISLISYFLKKMIPFWTSKCQLNEFRLILFHFVQQPKILSVIEKLVIFVWNKKISVNDALTLWYWINDSEKKTKTFPYEQNRLRTSLTPYNIWNLKGQRTHTYAPKKNSKAKQGTAQYKRIGWLDIFKSLRMKRIANNTGTSIAMLCVYIYRESCIHMQTLAFAINGIRNEYTCKRNAPKIQ